MISEPALGERPITGQGESGQRQASAPGRAGDLRPGDHLAHLYQNSAEQAAVAAEMLAGAVARGERALLVASPPARDATLEALAARAVDVEAARRRGALEVRSSGDVFLQGGSCDPARQARFWADQVERAHRDGFAGLAAAAVMDWALEGAPGARALVESASRVGLDLGPAGCAIFQYHRDRFPPETLRAVLRSHPLVIHGGAVLRNPYAVPSDAALGCEPASREVDRLLASMHEHGRAEQAARESEQRLRTVVSAVTAGIIFKGPNAEILDYNPAGGQILGVARDPATGRPGADPRLNSIHEDGSPYPLEEWPVMIAIRTGEPVRNAIMGLTRPEGDVRWLRVNAVPLAQPGAKPHAAVVSLDDVTDERRAWMEVRRGEQQLRLAMECAGHAYWEMQVASGRFVAGAPWTQLGYAEHDLDGSAEAWVALCHPDDRAAALARYQDHVEGWSPSYRCEYRARAKDGSWRWVLASGRAIARGPAGRALRLAGTITDVTESKRLELQLRQSDRLASVGTLAAGVAHEVNNPLAYVTTNLAFVDESLQLLAAGGPGAPSPADIRAAIGDALDGAARVKGIVQGLRQFATPPRTADRRPIDPRRQVEAALMLVRNEIAPRARLRVEVPPVLPAVVAGEHEISQVLVNLLVNAAQAIPEGRAAENEVAVSAEARAGRLALTVRDSGAGIAAADLPRIFDPFFTTKPVGGGSGLGLSICHGIVSALGGAIEVDSTPGRGSTFRVLLPIAASCPAPAPSGEGAAAASARARVLVVDDEPLVGNSLVRLLGSAHDVTALTSPAEALRRARGGESWDVVLCDLMMPEMSGMELEEALLEARPDLVPRILYLTGGAFTERSRAFLAAGRPHLEKPVAPAELRAAVAELTRRAAA